MKARGESPTPKTPRPFKPTGKSVSRLRGKSGLSAAEFAERIGVSVGSVYRWENAQGALSFRSDAWRALQRLRDELETG